MSLNFWTDLTVLDEDNVLIVKFPDSCPRGSLREIAVEVWRTTGELPPGTVTVTGSRRRGADGERSSA